jgi:site-specific DNA recombinase
MQRVDFRIMTTDRTAAIYVRISSDPGGLRQGVERQLQDCQALCKSKGWNVSSVFEDNDTSAYSGKPRRGYRALCEAIKAGSVGVVVAWHSDRLHRSPRELEGFIDLVEASGVTVATVQSGELDLSTATGRMVARMLGAAARHESEHKSERIRRKHQQIREDGGWHGGGRQFGFDYDRRPDGSVVQGSGLHVVEAEAEAIREAAEKMLAGASTASVARYWNSIGLLTPRGNPWNGKTAGKVMASPLIRGLHSTTLKPTQAGAILDAETGEALAAKLANPARCTNGGINATKNPVAGFLRCGRCGGLLYTGKVNKLSAMRCDKGKSSVSCGRLTVKLEPLVDELGALAVERLLLAHKALRKASGAARQRGNGKAMTSELDVLRARLDEANGMFTDGDITKAEFLGMKRKLKDRQTRLLATLAASQEAVTVASLPTTREGLQALWDSEDFDSRRKMMALAFDEVQILPAAHKGQRFKSDRVLPTFRDLAA